MNEKTINVRVSMKVHLQLMKLKGERLAAGTNDSFSKIIEELLPADEQLEKVVEQDEKRKVIP